MIRPLDGRGFITYWLRFWYRTRTGTPWCRPNCIRPLGTVCRAGCTASVCLGCFRCPAESRQALCPRLRRSGRHWSRTGRGTDNRDLWAKELRGNRTKNDYLLYIHGYLLFITTIMIIIFFYRFYHFHYIILTRRSPVREGGHVKPREWWFYTGTERDGAGDRVLYRRGI